jgi:undecaprenyl-phosphate galactose phosphotransferase
MNRYPLWDEVKEIVKAVIIATVVVLAIISLGKLTDKISRLSVIFLMLYGIIIFPLFRFWGKKFLYNLGIWQKPMLIIGAGNAGQRTAQVLMNDKHTGYKIIGFLDDNKNEPININGKSIPVLGKLKDYKKVIKDKNLEAVLIAIPSLEKEKLIHLINSIHKYVKRIFVVPDITGIALLNSELYHLFMQQLFLIKINNNLQSKLSQFLKRSFDLFLAILLLPILLPVIGIIAVLIKLDSKGPVFFSHTRIGKDGKEIKVYKFRSMYIDAQERLNKILENDPKAKEEWEKCFKLKNDPRVTKVGKFLRKTSLDELPQTFNVLKGDMSFVGPRPVTKDEIEKYYKDYAEYYYMVRPGITGLWQVSGRSNTDYDFRVKLDTWYVLNWALWLDIVILLKTIKVVLKREGAY